MGVTEADEEDTNIHNVNNIHLQHWQWMKFLDLEVGTTLGFILISHEPYVFDLMHDFTI